MKRVILTAVFAMMSGIILTGGVGSAAAKPGETLFKQYCVACHPDGGNIINPQKSLHKKDLEKNKIMTADDIVKVMRNPGPGMSKFDAKTIPDKNARQIAEYILSTYK